MNKNLKIGAIVVIALGLIVGGGSLVMAQTANPETPAALCGGGLGFRGASQDVVTDLIGLTHDEIRAQRLEGKSLAEIAAAKGVSEDALVGAIVGAHTEALKAAVTAGRLTQAQADAALQDMEARVRLMVESKGVGPFGLGSMKGLGGCRGLATDDVPATQGARAGFGMMGMRR